MIFVASSPYHANVVTAYRDLISVTATDRYTVVFKWKTPYLEPMRETLQAPTNAACLEAREAVEKWGDVADWHHAIGTGPFILKDFVDNVSATLIRNPNYWGHDERHPQNQLPYIDRLKFKIILDDDDALQAMARGEVDVMDGLTYHQYLQLKKLNCLSHQLNTKQKILNAVLDGTETEQESLITALLNEYKEESVLQQ